MVLFLVPNCRWTGAVPPPSLSACIGMSWCNLNLLPTYNWINQLSNTTIWWLDICCLLHRYQLHVSVLMVIFRLID